MRLRNSRSRASNGLFTGVGELYDRFLKLTVDVPLDVSIIRPTSGADRNEKAFLFNELTGFSGSVSEEAASIQVIDSGEKKEFDTRL